MTKTYRVRELRHGIWKAEDRQCLPVVNVGNRTLLPMTEASREEKNKYTCTDNGYRAFSENDGIY